MNFLKDPAKTAFAIATRLKENGFIAYFAGGCVRDFLMNAEPHDFDIATTARPEDVERLFPRTVSVGRQFGVMLVVEGERPYEVATFRREGGYFDGRHPTQVEYTVPKEDAVRRDFTINGLFYDPFERKVLDFVDGQADLKRCVLRAIGNPKERFEEDKLRLLRAVRFASSLGFEIDPKTWEAVQFLASKISEVSPERVRDEIIKILTRPNAAQGFQMLSKSGLMKQILPEIEQMKGVAQQPDFHPEGDVYIHTMLLLEKLKSPTATLALSALFHDVGKPQTYAVRDGKITFYEHAYLGAKMTKDIMKRLRFSNDEIESVSECVANHMKFGDVQKMRSGKLKLFVSRPTFDTEMELHRIDCESCHGMLENYYFLKEKLKEYAAEELKPKPLISGHDLMALGIKSGPEMKPLLEEIYILQLEGSFKSREDAVSWIKMNRLGEQREG